MDRVRGLGRAIFAAVLLMIGGVLNIIYGIAAIGNSSFFVHNTHYVFASLKGWGWITLILGILEVLASLSLFGGGEYGRWFAIVVGALAALGALLSISAYPLWSIAIFALSLWIIYGLIIYREPEPTQVAGPSQSAPPPTTAPGTTVADLDSIDGDRPLGRGGLASVIPPGCDRVMSTTGVARG